MQKALIHIMTFLAALFCYAQPASATSDNFLIQHFEPSNPQFDIAVSAIIQDSRGYVWFGTNNGLFRYDGFELLPIHYPSMRPGFMRIRSICEDAFGDIWIGTNGGLVKYSHKTGNTETFRPEDPGFAIISKVLSLPSGKIAFCARNYGAWILNPATGEYDRIVLPDTAEDETLAACLGDAGMLYLWSAEKGLYRLDTSRSLNAEHIKKLVGGGGRNPLDGIVLFNIEYYDYKIIAGIAEKTFILDLKSGKVEERDWSIVTAICPRQEGGFYAATSKGLLEVDSKLDVIRHWSEDFSDKYAIHDKSIRALCKDRENNLWIGTNFEGVYFLARNRSEMKRYYPSGSTPECAMRVRAIVEDEDGIIWMGSENGGLIRYDRSIGRHTRIPLPIETNNILALCADGPWLWVGSHSRKDPTIRLNRHTLKATAFPNLPKCLYYIYKDGEDWLFMSDDHALYHYNKRSNLLEEEEAISPAGFQYVNGIRGKDKELWLGGTGARVCRYKNGEITPLSDIVTDEEFKKLISYRNAAPKLVDSQGRLWVTLLDMGLYCVNTSDGTVRFYDITSGNHSADIFNIMEDREGILWITSGNGLIALSPENGKVSHYDDNDGILCAHFKSSSGIIASDGNLYAGLTEGMIVFDPVKFRSYPCEVKAPVFTGFKLKQSAENVADSSLNEYFEELEKGEISLSSSQNAFILGVSNMSYSIPRRSKLVYSLDNGKVWKDVENGKIEFSRLKHGDYTVKVRSMMSDGSLDEKESHIHIHIRVPRLLAAPFIAIYIFLLLIMLFSVAFFVRSASLRKAAEKAKLQAEVREAERQKELWSSKVEFLKGVAHDILNPLSMVKAPVESLLLRLGRSADATVVEEITTASRNADKLSEILESFINAQTDNNYIAPQSVISDKKDILAPRVNVPGTEKSILIVEKDPEILEFICTRLEEKYNVFPARNLKTAEEIIKTNIPDIVICDTDSGTTESYAFCTKLKSGTNTGHIPLVVISDNSGQKARVYAFNHGAEGFFSKPFSLSELMATINSLLGNRDKVKGSLSDRPSIMADKDFLDSLQKIMKAKLSDENLNVDILADEACMSTSGLFKRLKALTGMSPGEYITAYRMKEASTLIKDTNMSIDDISIKVGFRSHSYFSTCFKNNFGMSPKKYRQISTASNVNN